MNAPSAEDQVRFLSNLQRLLAEGQFVATYKYALLLRLADLAVEQGDDTDATLKIPTALIAEKFIHYYWRQTVPYVPRKSRGSTARILRQNTARQAEVVRRLENVRVRVGQSLVALQQDQRRWQGLVHSIERVVTIMPLWKLQTVGGRPLEFLYERSAENGYVELKPGVAYCLRKFHDLITDLVRGAWVRYIRRVNADVLETNVDLHEFLFGSERANLGIVQPILQELQKGKCFYCEGGLTPRLGTRRSFHPVVALPRRPRAQLRAGSRHVQFIKRRPAGGCRPPADVGGAEQPLRFATRCRIQAARLSCRS